MIFEGRILNLDNATTPNRASAAPNQVTTHIKWSKRKRNAEIALKNHRIQQNKLARLSAQDQSQIVEAITACAENLKTLALKSTRETQLMETIRRFLSNRSLLELLSYH
jgi:hypothetical protein